MYGLSYRKPTRLWCNSVLLQEFEAKFCGRDGCRCRHGQHQPLPPGSVNRSAVPAPLVSSLLLVLFQAEWEQGGAARQLAKKVSKVGAKEQTIEHGGKRYRVTRVD